MCGHILGLNVNNFKFWLLTVDLVGSDVGKKIENYLPICGKKEANIYH
jgi:hypothetical protein